MRNIPGLMALLLTLAACGSPLATSLGLGGRADGIELIVGAESYTRGEQGMVRLVNGSEDPVGHGACSLRLEQSNAAGWTAVGPDSGVCIAILYVVPTGGTAEFSFETASLAPGTYRYRLEILPDTQLPSTYIHSASFRILP